MDQHTIQTHVIIALLTPPPLQILALMEVIKSTITFAFHIRAITFPTITFFGILQRTFMSLYFLTLFQHIWHQRTSSAQIVFAEATMVEELMTLKSAFTAYIALGIASITVRFCESLFQIVTLIALGFAYECCQVDYIVFLFQLLFKVFDAVMDVFFIIVVIWLLAIFASIFGFQT